MESSFFKFCQFMCNLKTTLLFSASLHPIQQHDCMATCKKQTFFITILLGVLFLSTAAMASDEKDLVLYYNFDNDTLPVITDHSKFGNNGEAYEKVTLAEGISGKGIYFDGTLDSRIIVPPSESLNITKDLTISFWIKPGEVIIKQPGEKQDAQDLFFRDWNWRCIINRQGKLEIIMIGSDKKTVRIGTSVALTENKWTQMAYVFKGTAKTLSLYIDGKYVTKQRCDMNELRPEDSLKIFLGGGDSGWSFKGAMDEVRVYNYALDENEIKVIGLPVDSKSSNAIQVNN